MTASARISGPVAVESAKPRPATAPAVRAGRQGDVGPLAHRGGRVLPRSVARSPARRVGGIRHPHGHGGQVVGDEAGKQSATVIEFAEHLGQPSAPSVEGRHVRDRPMWPIPQGHEPVGEPGSGLAGPFAGRRARPLWNAARSPAPSRPRTRRTHRPTTAFSHGIETLAHRHTQRGGSSDTTAYSNLPPTPRGVSSRSARPSVGLQGCTAGMPRAHLP